MNEGKQRLEAMRKNLKKKANHIPSSVNNNSETGQDVKQVREQTNSNKIPFEQRFEKKDKEVQNGNKLLNINPSQTEPYPEKQNKILADPTQKLDEQVLQEGQIQEEQNQLAQEKQDFLNAQPIKNLNPHVNFSQSHEKLQQSNIINSQQNQKHKEYPQQSVNMELQPQVAQENENKNENISYQNSDKIIEEKSNQPLQNHSVHKFSKNPDQLQQKFDNLEQKIIESEQKQNLGEKSINTNKCDQNIDNNVQKQQIQKVASNGSVHSTQNLNLQSTLSHQNNSIHKSQGRVHHQSSKPAIKVVLKQLQMIKSTIHNLNVTYRGVEYLRQRIKHDSMLKRKIRERLIDLQGDNDMDVLRKLVKQVQQSCQRSSEIQPKSSTTASTKHHHLTHHPNNSLLTHNKQSLVSQKMISQPQISLSNEVIDY